MIIIGIYYDFRAAIPLSKKVGERSFLFKILNKKKKKKNFNEFFSPSPKKINFFF
jgi:hypothetical protein